MFLGWLLFSGSIWIPLGLTNWFGLLYFVDEYVSRFGLWGLLYYLLFGFSGLIAVCDLCICCSLVLCVLAWVVLWVGGR